MNIEQASLELAELNVVLIRQILAKSNQGVLELAKEQHDEILRLRAAYKQCHSELLAIHEIACCGWANVLQHPITPEDTLTVRDVKIMAMELMKD